MSLRINITTNLMRWSLISILLLGLAKNTYAQTSWKDAKKTRQANITVFHVNFAPFIYTQNQQVTGLEAELMQNFVKFVQKQYGIKTKLTFELQKSFGDVYQKVKKGNSGTFAASSFSVTQARKKEVQFSPIYMPDISIVISSNNLPILADTSEVATRFGTITAVQVPKSTDVQRTQRIAPYFNNLQYKNIKRFEDIPLVVSQNDDHIAYVQLITYFTALQGKFKVKRQNLFQINKIGMAIVLPLDSDWKEPIDAFFKSPEFKPLANRIIKKYFGDDVKDLIWQISNTEGNNNKSILLLTKEKELKEMEIARKQLELNQQTLQRNISFVIVFTILIVAFFIYNRYQMQQRNNKTLKQKQEELLGKNEELQQQKEKILTQQNFIENKNVELERKNKEVASSIKTARIIQKSILPHNKRMQNILTEHFVLYRPKDIVSGDFYWLARRNNKVFLAVADCTGHGVPGALMSMISYMTLDKLVIMEKLDDPAEILNRCHSELQQSLQAQEDSSSYGMDLAFVVLETLENEQTKITFAGAKRPLFYIPVGQTSIQEVSGTRRSIGGFHRNNIHFSHQEIVLDKGSLIYMTSDGYTDQNDIGRRKYGIQKMKQLLENVANKPLEAQKEDIEQTLNTHMAGTTQRDDILVVGFKV